MTAIMVWAAGAVVVGALGVWFSRRLPRRWLVWAATIGSGVFLAASATMLAWSVAAASGDRSPRALQISSAVSYERVAIDEPRRQVFHVAVIEFDDPCVGVVTTRPLRGGLAAAETGTEFVERTGSVVSINVAFFYPFDEYPYWASYPQTGDLVTAIGPVVIGGEWLGDVDGGGDVGLALTAGRLSAATIPGDADFGVRGRIALVADGISVAPESPAYARAVAGVDLDENHLVLLVSDGKQPGYADGSTYQDIAEFLIGLGVDEAVEFDGGGSATMAGIVDGNVELLNRPSHQRLPGRQRPVATHLGITMDPECP